MKNPDDPESFRTAALVVAVAVFGFPSSFEAALPPPPPNTPKSPPLLPPLTGAGLGGLAGAAPPFGGAPPGPFFASALAFVDVRARAPGNGLCAWALAGAGGAAIVDGLEAPASSLPVLGLPPPKRPAKGLAGDEALLFRGALAVRATAGFDGGGGGGGGGVLGDGEAGVLGFAGALTAAAFGDGSFGDGSFAFEGLSSTLRGRIFFGAAGGGGGAVPVLDVAAGFWEPWGEESLA